jgi:tripartite-type tricarboxylate transporter receptor subunit TctC
MRNALFAVACILAGAMGNAYGQAYPSRPPTIVVPFPAGGPTDTLARILADRMGASLGRTVIIENISGASGSIGVGRVARAMPDGYTLSIGHLGTHVINGAIYPLQYDVLTDLEPIALLATNPQLIITKNSIAAKDLKELVVWLRENQEKVTVGISGVGTPSHVMGLYLQSRIGAHLQFVPYRGSAPALQDAIAGHIDLFIDQASSSLPQVRAGGVKAYAVTAKSRLSSAPEIPTVDEAGLPGLYLSVWHGLWAPKGTPKEIVTKLTVAVQAALADKATRERLADLGQEIPAIEEQTPEGLAAVQKAEIEKWWPIVRAADIKAE